MKYLVILAHPDKRSFNNSIAEVICDSLTKSGNDVIFHNLYEENFDPVLSIDEINRKFSFDEIIQKHNVELSKSDHLIFIHPDWWGQMPAILKGWLDRVFRQGTVFEYEGPDFTEKQKTALLTGKSATVIITSDREPEKMLLESIWKKDILSYCGIEDAGVLIHFDSRNADLEERDLFLERIISRISNKNQI
jgi:NAD(P)H dehydrogenase (quinone)